MRTKTKLWPPEAFVAASRLYAKFDCNLVPQGPPREEGPGDEVGGRQNSFSLATARA